MFVALYQLHSKFNEEELLAPFDGRITPQMLDGLRHLLPTVNAYTYKVSDFTNETFPFDAYSENSSAKTIVQSKKEGLHG